MKPVGDSLDTALIQTGVRFRLPVLAVGPAPMIAGFLQRTKRHIPTPVIEVDCASTPFRFDGAAGTIVFRDVDRLSPDEQLQIREWLHIHHGDVQVVSTGSRSIFPLVEHGSFSDALYYQLNAIYLDFTSQ